MLWYFLLLLIMTGSPPTALFSQLYQPTYESLSVTLQDVGAIKGVHVPHAGP